MVFPTEFISTSFGKTRVGCDVFSKDTTLFRADETAEAIIDVVGGVIFV
uniref:Uncharacterized protein n=1 Tax=viral metagenome TaxID=1070528 RepID=A0A6C0H1B5_9ZZZZ